MNTLISVYQSHDAALKATNTLKSEGFNANAISILGKADMINNHIHVKTDQNAEVAEVSVGVLAGATLGILTGVGIFAIPGLGFLYGAGALVGAIAGIDFGIIGSGVVAMLTFIGVEKKNAEKYEKHLNESKFLLFLKGTKNDVDRAEHILNATNLHLELDRG